MSDLHHLTATELVDGLRNRQFTSRELTEHYLDRIDRHRGLGAFLTVTPDLACAEADTADAALASGDHLQPLTGLPLGIKDAHLTSGVATTYGSAALRDLVPATDGWTVGLLRRAGCVLLGKTNTPEFGPTCYTDNDLAGPAVTPYDTGRYASGSSGGAAAAVAAGLQPVGHGSDAAGSLRTPAGVCHLVGIKPSRGLVSSAPAVSFIAPATEGVLARTTADAALLLDVMASPPPHELHAWQLEGSFAAATRRDPGRRLRLAAWTDSGIDGHVTAPEAVRGVSRTVGLLRELGHEVVELASPVGADDHVRRCLLSLFATGVTATVDQLVPPQRQHLLRPFTQHLLEIGRSLTATQLLTAESVLAAYAERHLRALAAFDVVVTPTAAAPAVPIGSFSSDGVRQEAASMLRWSCFTPWANLTGQPAVSLPLHTGADGLPYGVQLVGRRRQDLLLGALAGQLERAAPWAEVHPPCWDQ